MTPRRRPRPQPRRDCAPFAPGNAFPARWRGRAVPAWQRLGPAGRLRLWRADLYRIAPGIAERMPSGASRFLLRRTA